MSWRGHTGFTCLHSQRRAGDDPRQPLAPHELNTLGEQAKVSHLISCKCTSRHRILQYREVVTVTLPHTRYSRHDFWGEQAETDRKMGRYSKKRGEHRLIYSTWDPLQSPSLGKQLVLSSRLLCFYGLCMQFHEAAIRFFLKALLKMSQWEGNL